MKTAVDRRGSIGNLTETSVGTGLHILLVGIDTDFSSSLAQLLSAYGHEVRIIPPRSAALEADGREWSDVIVRDLDKVAWEGDSLPGGLEPCGRKKRPFVIVVSTCDREKNNANLFRTSGDLHLVKPFNPGFLLRLVGRFHSLLRE